MIISVPGIDGGLETNAFAYVWDVMPTILDIAGIEHPETFNGKPVERMQGRSLVFLLKGEVEQVYTDDEYVAGELVNGKWIRQGKYKAVSIPKPTGTALGRYTT